MSTNGNALSDGRRGLLDISVEQSISDLTAGNEFSVYVLIKNPFGSPVWIPSVTVSVPSEIDLPQWRDAKQRLAAEEGKAAEQSKLALQRQVEREAKIFGLKQTIGRIDERLRRNGDMPDAERQQLENELAATEVLLRKEKLANDAEAVQQPNSDSLAIEIDGATRVDTVDVAAFSNARLRIGGDAMVGSLRVGRTGAGAGGTNTREVDLASTLPAGVPLQPGDTAVYTVIFKTKSQLLFRPAQYKLHFNVAYHFGQVTELRVNTVASTFSIRAAISAIMTGALIGGLAGFVARQLQVYPSVTALMQDNSSSLFPFLLSLILSLIAVVFIARKSETQSIVTVEDFWGGILIGFIVGYSGVAAFQKITGITPTTFVPAQGG